MKEPPTEIEDFDPGEHRWPVNERGRDAEKILTLVVSDYDRRRERWWGRLLLFLLRKTT